MDQSIRWSANSRHGLGREIEDALELVKEIASPLTPDRSEMFRHRYKKAADEYGEDAEGAIKQGRGAAPTSR